MKTRAFTLIELSIVLLIISLIISGITLGKNIVNNSKIIGVIGEVNQYKSAINQFRNQYGALPGDITNASTFWPTCSLATGDSGNSSDCNGNGDGIIGVFNQSYWQGTLSTNESLRAWQHLSLAKMIPGSYSGFGPNNLNIGKFDFNTPRSKYPNSGYSFWADNCYTNGNQFFLTLSNIITSAAGTSIPYSVLPSDAYYIDSKMDDSNPKSGNVIARSSDISESCGYTPTSSACVNGSASTYYTSNNSGICVLYFNYLN